MAMNENAAKALAAARANRAGVKRSGVSRSSAIREKCKDCIYDNQEPGTWLSQVDACDDRSCALWPVRPKRRLAK